jgi:hypothetical protein
MGLVQNFESLFDYKYVEYFIAMSVKTVGRNS